jgi:hypothetical protein
VIAGVAEVQSGARSGHEQDAADVEVNGVAGGSRGEGVSLDKNDGGDALLREREEGSALQSDGLEKNGRLEASDDRLKSAMAEVVRLTSVLDGNVELLNECQVSEVWLCMELINLGNILENR